MLSQTLDRLCRLHLHGMAQELQQQMERGTGLDLSFEDRLDLLVQREELRRADRSLERRLKAAQFKVTARLEDVDYRHPRGLNRKVVQNLATCEWVFARRNVVITAATGLGKTWLVCALGDKACRDGYTAIYKRVPRLTHELAVARADGSYLKLLQQLARTDLLVLDDWGMNPLEGQAQHDLLEVIDDRLGLRSTMVTSQLPVGQWHDHISDATVADALLDRLLQPATIITLKGESMRKTSKAEDTTAK